MAENSQNPHAGHRERLKNRFLETGLDSFHAVNTLELILFFAVPRKDTNPIAHRLLDHFGSLAGVLDAPVEELMKIDGITKNAAVLLHLFPQTARQYEISRTADLKILDTTDKAGRYLLPRYTGERSEVVYLLCLDAKCRVLDCRLLFRGGFSSAAASVRKIIETALAVNAYAVILSHNHTSGIAQPSMEDEQTTRALEQALHAVDILLVDHIIVADGDYFSMADAGFFKQEAIV